MTTRRITKRKPNNREHAKIRACSLKICQFTSVCYRDYCFYLFFSYYPFFSTFTLAYLNGMVLTLPT